MADVRTNTQTDTQIIAEAPPSPTHVTIRREDYRPPDWLVPEISLDFDLDPERTRARSRLHVARNGAHQRPLRLDGDGLAPLKVLVDGRWSSRSPATKRWWRPRSRSRRLRIPS
jgi:aminopeptidase N